MARKEPLYPHVPKGKEPQFPHRTSGESSKQTTGVLPDGQLVLLKSGTEGWIKGQIVEYFDLIPSVGGKIYAGPGYKVYILEGKHKGETIRVPANYVKAMQPQSVAQTKSCPQKYVHVLSSGQTVFHYDDTIALEVFEKENERVKKRGETPATGEIMEYGKYKRLPQTTKKPTRDDVTVQSWQERDRLGIWITDNRTDKTFAEWWDDEARQMFEDGFFKPGVPRYATEKPSKEFVESVLDYAESVGLLASSGKYLASTINLLAKTEGDPLRKFCCRQCGECAPKELLEEGRFPDRIAWLRNHYADKHPGMWGKTAL